MRDWEIRQDLEHRYLVTTVDEVQENYRIQMLVHQTSEQLLPCTTRRVNGELMLTYDISGKQSLAQLCAAQSVGIGMLHILFGTVYLCLRQLEEYLLEAEMLLLSPETIFCDEAGSRIYLCCLPGAENGGFDGLHDLSVFLLEVLDHTDAEAVQLGYTLYRSCLPGKLQQGEVMRLLRECAQKIGGDETEPVTDRVAVNAATYAQTSEKQQRRKPLPGQTEIGGQQPIHKTDFQKKQGASREAFAPTDRKAPLETINPANREAPRGVFEPAAQKSLHEAQEEYSLPMPAGGWTLPQSMWPGTKKKQSRREQRKTERQKELSRKEQRKEQQKEARWQETQREPDQERKVLPAYAAEKLFSYGEKSCMLQGMQKGLPTFSPAAFPFLIGSLEFAADGYIDDVTVSRFHARLEKKEDGYYLTDLDSAHGTKRNGSSLVPQTETKLENGDEICFGRTVFRMIF